MNGITLTSVLFFGVLRRGVIFYKKCFLQNNFQHTLVTIMTTLLWLVGHFLHTRFWLVGNFRHTRLWLDGNFWQTRLWLDGNFRHTRLWLLSARPRDSIGHMWTYIRRPFIWECQYSVVFASLIPRLMGRGFLRWDRHHPHQHQPRWRQHRI